MPHPMAGKRGGVVRTRDGRRCARSRENARRADGRATLRPGGKGGQSARMARVTPVGDRDVEDLRIRYNGLGSSDASRRPGDAPEWVEAGESVTRRQDTHGL